MARFQTYLADILKEQTPDHAQVDWNAFAKTTGISDNTLRSWYEARVGSDIYLNGFNGATAANLMRYFGLTQLSQLIEVVFEEDETPQLV